MMKWILNKGLKFQIILALFLALSVPTAVLLWNVLVPSKMSDAVRSMQEYKSKDLLEYLEGTIDKKQIINFDNSGKGLSIISSSIEPLSRTVRDTRIGIYISSNKKRYAYGKLLDRTSHIKNEEINCDDVEKGIEENFKKVIETKVDKIGRAHV